MKKTMKTILLLSTLAGLVACGNSTSSTGTEPKSDTTTSTTNTTTTNNTSTGTTTATETPHTHTFSGAYLHDKTKHWKVCDAGDGAISEEGEHVYTANNHICDVCGYDRYEGMGSITGKVKLHKAGGYATDYTGLTITTDDENVVVTTNTEDGSFKLEGCEIEKTITITFEKAGYQSMSKVVMATTADGVDTIKDTTMEYTRFVKDIKKNWDAALTDYSHVNDEDPYLGFNYDVTGKTLICNTVDEYDDVYGTWTAKKEGISVNGERIQGIYFLFPNVGKIAPIQLNGNNYRFESRKDFWAASAENGDTIMYTNVFTSWSGTNLTEEQQDRYNSDEGIKVGALRRKDNIGLVINGEVVYNLSLPAELAEEKVKVGYYVFDCANTETGSVKFHFNVENDFTNYAAKMEISSNDASFGTITNKVEKTFVGEKTDIEITPNDGYMIKSITNNGEDVFADFVDGHLRTKVKAENKIVVTFAVKTVGIVSASIQGVEFDSLKRHAFEDGVKVVLKNNMNEYETVTSGGKIEVKDVEVGTGYTVSIKDGDDWCSSDEFEVKKDETYSGELLLSENALVNNLPYWYSNNDLKNNHLKDGYFSLNHDCMYIKTKKTYKQGAATLRLYSDIYDNEFQGIVARFKTGDKEYKYVSIRDEKNLKLQFNKDAMEYHIGSSHGKQGNDEKASPLTGWHDFLSYASDTDNTNWAGNTALTADELKAFGKACEEKRKKNELTISLVRDGVNFYAFVDGRYIAKETIDASYADKEVEFVFWNTGCKNQDYKDFHVSLTSDISSYLAKVK